MMIHFLLFTVDSIYKDWISHLSLYMELIILYIIKLYNHYSIALQTVKLVHSLWIYISPYIFLLLYRIYKLKSDYFQIGKPQQQNQSHFLIFFFTSWCVIFINITFTNIISIQNTFNRFRYNIFYFRFC
jgi:chromate transport protein ChrA